MTNKMVFVVNGTEHEVELMRFVELIPPEKTGLGTDGAVILFLDDQKIPKYAAVWKPDTLRAMRTQINVILQNLPESSGKNTEDNRKWKN